MFVKITIKSKDLKSLQKFVLFLNKVFVTKKLKNSFFFKYFKIPNSKKVFTLLKSPHVNKSAQDTYEFTTFSFKIKIYSFKIFKFLFVLKRMNLKLFPDVKTNIFFIFEKPLVEDKNFRVDNFKIKNLYTFNNKFKKSKVKTYLKILDSYGESIHFV